MQALLDVFVLHEQDYVKLYTSGEAQKWIEESWRLARQVELLQKEGRKD